MIYFPIHTEPRKSIISVIGGHLHGTHSLAWFPVNPSGYISTRNVIGYRKGWYCEGCCLVSWNRDEAHKHAIDTLMVSA